MDDTRLRGIPSSVSGAPVFVLTGPNPAAPLDRTAPGGPAPTSGGALSPTLQALSPELRSGMRFSRSCSSAGSGEL